MRVLWMIDSLGPGGAESLMVPLLKNLKNQVEDPRVCVLNIRLGNPIAADINSLGIPVDLIQVQNLRSFSSQWQLFNYIRKHRPDIIHTQLETSDILGSLGAKLLGIPSISTVHTLDVPSSRMKKYWRNLLRWNCLKLIAKRVIVVSEFTRQHYIGLGFNKKKLLTIYNGIDLNQFIQKEITRPCKKEIFGLPDDSVVITTVAVLRELKGLQYMLYAIPGLMAKIPNLYYAIVGDGDYRETLENLARSLGISDRVVFMSHRTDIPKILAASNLFVYPTLKDALPTALLEAMAAGVPIVASKIGGVPEIIENDVSGLLVPPASPSSFTEACLRLLCNPDLANRLTTAARDTINQRFDIRHQAASIFTFYNQILSDHEY